MAALSLLIAPTASALSVYELKQHARIDIDIEDTLLSHYIAQAQEWVEEVSGRTLVTQTWQWTFQGFPDSQAVLQVPKPPLQQVLSIQYVDTQGQTQTLPVGEYQIDKSNEPGLIAPAYNKTWPDTRRQFNAVTIQFVAGYVTPFTANPSTDVLTAQGRTFADDDIVVLSTTDDGELPAGLTPATRYYVVTASGSTLQLAATQGGAAINITDSGSDSMFFGQLPAWVRHAIRLLAADAYMNREESSVRNLQSIPFGVRNLVNTNRVWM